MRRLEWCSDNDGHAKMTRIVLLNRLRDVSTFGYDEREDNGEVIGDRGAEWMKGSRGEGRTEKKKKIR